MDKTEYITKCEAFLQDNSVYQHLSKDTSPTTHKELIKILQYYKNNNFISETEYNLLRPHCSNSTAVRFYGVPKIHKNIIPMCSIVSACGTATYKLPNSSIKYFTISVVRLHPLFKIVQISSKHLSINSEEETLVLFDVSALFTSIPVPVTLQAINSKISTCANVTSICKIPTKNSPSF